MTQPRMLLRPRTCLAEHPFPLKEPIQPLIEEFQKPIAVDLSWLSLTLNLFRSAVKISLPTWISTMYLQPLDGLLHRRGDVEVIGEVFSC